MRLALALSVTTVIGLLMAYVVLGLTSPHPDSIGANLMAISGVLAVFLSVAFVAEIEGEREKAPDQDEPPKGTL